MSRVAEGRMEEGGEGRFSARSDEPEARSEVRWGARRKEGIVWSGLGFAETGFSGFVLA